MRPSTAAVTLLSLLNPTATQGFLNSPKGSPDPFSKILEDELLKEVKHPPVVNHILRTSEECRVDYWSRPDIHTLGNVGFGGAVHAAMAPFATKVSAAVHAIVYFHSSSHFKHHNTAYQMIDIKAYGGVDVRALVSYCHVS